MDRLNLRAHMFQMPYFSERLDNVQEPVSFLDWEERPNSFHIFQYPCLFPPRYLVGYFRMINFTKMFEQLGLANRAAYMQTRMDVYLREPYWWLIRSRLKLLLSDYFVLEVSRQNALQDSLDQIWGQQKRLLLKPLKVKLGMQEGEVGLDQGGVTYEYFRLVLSEAFKPDTGEYDDAELRLC